MDVPIERWLPNMLEVTFYEAGSIPMLKQTDLFTQHPVPTNSIFQLHPAGSGFVIGKATSHVTVNGRVVSGLGVSAGHCFGIKTVLNRQGLLTLFDSQGNVSEDARWELLHSFIDFQISPGRDPMTGAFYPLPGDLGLVAIYDCEAIEKFTISEHIYYGSDITVAGYPMMLENPLSMAPSLQQARDSIQAKRQAIMTAYHEFRHPVCSVGRILGLNTEHIAFNAPTGNGMSGSPVFFEGTNVVVGMLQSGPVLPGGYEAFLLARQIESGITRLQLEQACQHLEALLSPRLRKKIHSSVQELLNLMELYIHDLSLEDQANEAKDDFVEDELYGLPFRLIQQAVTEKHNVGMAVTNPTFVAAIRARDRFEALLDSDFGCVEELWQAICS